MYTFTHRKRKVKKIWMLQHCTEIEDNRNQTAISTEAKKGHSTKNASNNGKQTKSTRTNLKRQVCHQRHRMENWQSLQPPMPNVKA